MSFVTNIVNGVRQTGWKLAAGATAAGAVTGLIAGHFISYIASHTFFWAIVTAGVLTAAAVFHSNFRPRVSWLVALVGGAVLGVVGSMVIGFFASPALLLLVGAITGLVAAPMLKSKLSA